MHLPPPIAAVIAAGIVLLADALVPATSFVFAGQRIVGAVVAIGGIALMAWTFLHFRRARTTILPDRLDERAPEMTVLLTDGPFAWSRNPIYLAMALFVTGIGVGLGSLVAPFAVAAFVWFIQTQTNRAGGAGARRPLRRGIPRLRRPRETLVRPPPETHPGRRRGGLRRQFAIFAMKSEIALALSTGFSNTAAWLAPSMIAISALSPIASFMPCEIS